MSINFFVIYDIYNLDDINVYIENFERWWILSNAFKENIRNKKIRYSFPMRL